MIIGSDVSVVVEIDYIEQRCKISIFFREFPALGYIAEGSHELNVLKQGISGI